MPCYCPLDDVIDTVGKKYAIRHKDFEAELAVTSTSSAAASTRFHHGWSITLRGRELEERLQPLLQWAAKKPEEQE